MDSSVGDDDPVVKEHPLHPSHLPHTSDNILSARICGEGEGVELDMKVRPRGENYSTSRGEHYARMVSLGTDDGSGMPEETYDSDLFDKLTLTSTPTPLKTPRYAIAAFQNGTLHITPLQGVVQLRPSLSYLDKVDIGMKRLETSASRDGDTTESEGEEAKPVTVKFAKHENIAKSQKKVGQKLSFTETMRKKKQSCVWTEIPHYGIHSEEAEEERRLLLAGDEDQRGVFSLSEEKYLDAIFPREVSGQKETDNGTSGLPIGVVSLEQIKKLPLNRQVMEVLRNAHMIQFGRLCSLLGVSGGKMGGVLEAVMRCGVLVQGCWVVASSVIFPKANDAAKRNARDYILWCFSQRRLVPRKDIMGVVKLPNEEVRQMMQSLAVKRFIPQQSWEFKLEYDLDFVIRNGAVVAKEEERWNKRHKELGTAINLKSPASVKPSVSMDSTSSHAPGGEEVLSTNAGELDDKTPSRHSSESNLRPQAISMPTDIIPMDTDIGTAPASSEDECMSLQPGGPILSPPVSHETTLLNQVQSSLAANAVKSDQLLSVPIKQEKPNPELVDAVVELCREAIGRGVVGVSEIKDRLLLKQMSVEEGHPFKEQGIPESLLESGLRLCGAMEVGQPCGKRLFALSHDEHCRAAILELYQSHKILRKKQIIEELEARKVNISEKILIKVLKELCSGKGGHWRLLGT